MTEICSLIKNAMSGSFKLLNILKTDNYYSNYPFGIYLICYQSKIELPVWYLFIPLVVYR